MNVQINCTEQGIGKLKRHLSSFHKAFMVLDDVDHIDQLDVLFSPVKHNIHSGSLIFFIFSDKDLLTSWRIVESSIYK